MFLPGIFNEYEVEDVPNEMKKTPMNNVTRQGSTNNPKDLVRVFSTVSFNGPPPLETRKSQALITLTSQEKPNEEKTSFWGQYLFFKYKQF